MKIFRNIIMASLEQNNEHNLGQNFISQPENQIAQDSSSSNIITNAK